MNMPQGSWEERGGWVVNQLAADFKITLVAATGIVGNLGFESVGFTTMQEKGQTAPRGGWGWAQWTGPRRRSFEAWADSQQLDRASDEANYGFLKLELSTAPYNSVILKLKAATTIEQAVWIVGQTYERPGGITESFLPGNSGRLKYALGAYNGARVAIATAPATSIAIAGDPIAQRIQDCVKTLQQALVAAGFDTGGIDGIPGPKTLAALKEWNS